MGNVHVLRESFSELLGVADYWTLTAYFFFVGFLCVHGEDEVEVSLQVQDLMLCEGHLGEAGPIVARLVTIILNIFFVIDE